MVMSSQNNNILQFNQYMMKDKMPYIIQADLESLIKIIDGYANIPKTLTPKTGEHIPHASLMLIIYTFDSIESKDGLHHGEDCMKKFCTSLRDYPYR